MHAVYPSVHLSHKTSFHNNFYGVTTLSTAVFLFFFVNASKGLLRELRSAHELFFFVHVIFCVLTRSERVLLCLRPRVICLVSLRRYRAACSLTWLKLSKEGCLAQYGSLWVLGLDYNTLTLRHPCLLRSKVWNVKVETLIFGSTDDSLRQAFRSENVQSSRCITWGRRGCWVFATTSWTSQTLQFARTYSRGCVNGRMSEVSWTGQGYVITVVTKRVFTLSRVSCEHLVVIVRKRVRAGDSALPSGQVGWLDRWRTVRSAKCQGCCPDMYCLESAGGDGLFAFEGSWVAGLIFDPFRSTWRGPGSRWTGSGLCAVATVVWANVPQCDPQHEGGNWLAAARLCCFCLERHRCRNTLGSPNVSSVMVPTIVKNASLLVDVHHSNTCGSLEGALTWVRQTQIIPLLRFAQKPQTHSATRAPPCQNPSGADVIASFGGRAVWYFCCQYRTRRRSCWSSAHDGAFTFTSGNWNTWRPHRNRARRARSNVSARPWTFRSQRGVRQVPQSGNGTTRSL